MAADPKAPDAEVLTDELVAAYRAELYPTVSLDDPEVLDDLRLLAGRIAQALSAAVSEGRPLDDLELVTVRSLGSRQWADDLHPHELIRLHHIAPRLVHRHILGVLRSGEGSDPYVRIRRYQELTSSILAISGQIRASVHRSIHPSEQEPDAEQPLTSSEALLADLLDSRGSEAMLIARANGLGFHPGPLNIVVSAELRGARDDSLMRVAGREIGTLLDREGTHPLAEVLAGRLTILLPTKGGGGDRLLEILDEALVAAKASARGVIAGISRPTPQVAGVRVAYEQSVRVVDLLRPAPDLPDVMTYDKALPYLALSADPEIAMDAYRTIEPLAVHDAAEGTRLVETLGVLLEVPGNLTEAARRLHLHRHTLYKRIERIEEITGRSFDDTTDRLSLELGVRALRLVLGRDR